MVAHTDLVDLDQSVLESLQVVVSAQARVALAMAQV
jgi:hypothetical protein